MVVFDAEVELAVAVAWLVALAVVAVVASAVVAVPWSVALASMMAMRPYLLPSL